MCDSSPENQPYPGLHQNQYGQQVEGDDSFSLCHPNETPPGVLHPVLGSTIKEIHGPARTDPEEACGNDQRAGGQAERVGVVKPEEEKTLGRTDCGLPVIKRGLQE